MKNKKTLIIVITLGILCIIGGMIYSGYTRNGIDGIRAITTNLLSQSVEETLVTDTEVAPTMTTEQVTDRIRRIEIEILEETHDPDRIMELRRELYKLKNIQSKS